MACLISCHAFNGFEFLLQFKESVAQFANENIAPHASKIDHTNYFPQVCFTILLFNPLNEQYIAHSVIEHADCVFDRILGG